MLVLCLLYSFVRTDSPGMFAAYLPTNRFCGMFAVHRNLSMTCCLSLLYILVGTGFLEMFFVHWTSCLTCCLSLTHTFALGFSGMFASYFLFGSVCRNACCL